MDKKCPLPTITESTSSYFAKEVNSEELPNICEYPPELGILSLASTSENYGTDKA